MDKRRLEAFVRLVEQGSFRNTATELKTTQPALSQMIARLEKEVEIKLIDRSTRPIATTQAGKEFYFRAKKVLDAMGALDTLVEGAHQAQFGRVRIGIVPAMQFAAPARAVRTFQDAHPRVEAELRAISTADLIEELDQGSVDVAVLLTEPHLRDVSMQDLYSEEYMVCLPSGHPLTEKDSVEFADLEHETLIHGNRGGNPAGHDAIIAACASAGFVAKYMPRMGSFLDHAGLVSAGQGVAFLPTSFQYLRPNGVEYRTLVNPSIDLTVKVSWFEDRLDEAGKAFVKHCISECTRP